MITYPANLKHEKLRIWVDEMAALCKPDAVHWCDGSQKEYDELCEGLVKAGTYIRLNEEKRPNSFLAFSDPSDVAGRGSHVHLQRQQERRRPHQQLDGTV